MPAKRKITSTESLHGKVVRLGDASISGDEFQQVTNSAFVDKYRVEGLNGGDVFYQAQVCPILTFSEFSSSLTVHSYSTGR